MLRTLGQHNGDTVKIGKIASALLLAGRVLIALAFMSVALGQIFHYEDVVSMLSSRMPAAGFFIVVMVLCEFFGAASLAVGFFTRTGAGVLLASLVPFLILFYSSAANKVFMAAAFAFAGALLPYLAVGPGPLSLDQVKKTEAKPRRGIRRYERI